MLGRLVHRPLREGGILLSQWPSASLIVVMGVLPVLTLRGWRQRLIAGGFALVLVPVSLVLLARAAPGQDGSWGYLLLLIPVLVVLNVLFSIGLGAGLHRMLAWRSGGEPSIGVPLLSVLAWAAMAALGGVFVLLKELASGMLGG